MSNNYNPAAILYDGSGNPLGVQDGIAVPPSTSSLLVSGRDTNDISRNIRVDNQGHVHVVSGLASHDAFGRTRVSNPVTAFDSKLLRDKDPLKWTELLVGTGTSVYNVNQASVTLATVANADRVVRQTKSYYNYQSGKSQLIFASFNLNGGTANVIKSVGIFDDLNGLFFRLNGLVPEFVRRSSVTGIAVDTAAVQSAWSIDKMNGTGPSGITLDLSTVQILVIDYEWLGVGVSRLGFVIDGEIHYAHVFKHANQIGANTVYMSTPNLPIRYELDSSPIGAGAGTMTAICSTIISEGGSNQPGSQRGFAMPLTGKSVGLGIPTPVLGLRLGVAGIRAFVKLTNLDVTLTRIGAAKNFSWRVVLNPTFTGGILPTWVPTLNSVVETDIAATGTWNLDGIVVAAGTANDRGSVVGFRAENALPLGADVAGLVSDVYYLIVESDGLDVYFGSALWNEV